MTVRNLVGAMVVAALAVGVAGSAKAEAPAAFGPIESRAFHWKAGTSIERAGSNCNNNSDWLIVRGPGIANVKSVDVSPRTSMSEKQSFPSSACVAPDCYQLFFKVTERDAVGPRTVTFKHADGRTVTTTFDVVENAGRCDYPKGKK